MHLADLPNKALEIITTELEDKDIKQLTLLNKQHKATFSPVLATRKARAFVKLYICKQLFISNDDVDAYNERYFELAALHLKHGKLFTTEAEAKAYHFKQDALCGLYVVNIPYDRLVINPTQGLSIEKSYLLTTKNIEGLYFHRFKAGEKYKKNTHCLTSGQVFALFDSPTIIKPQPVDQATAKVDHKAKGKCCTIM
jgi:hypothetical protein